MRGLYPPHKNNETATLPNLVKAGAADRPTLQRAPLQLHNLVGVRKYLTAEERRIFLHHAHALPPRMRSLCMTLAYSGCRLSEALNLTADRVDLSAGVLIFHSLKKRREGVYRAVPVPDELLHILDRTHALAHKRLRPQRRLWPVSRMTGWRWVVATMNEAGIYGEKASPKGLRHSFGVSAVSAGIPLHLVQRWLGHASMTTTAIYAQAVGDEEKRIAMRIWDI